MTDHPERGSEQQERREAAQEATQHVVETVTSWSYSAGKDQIDQDLDAGLAEAGVEVDGREKQRLATEIDQVKDDEGRGAPRAQDAEPSE